MTKFKKRKALPFKFQKKKKKEKRKSKGCCFIVENFQIINIGKAVNFISTRKIYFETWRFFRKASDKSRLKVGIIEMSDFKKCIFNDPVIVNTAFL